MSWRGVIETPVRVFFDDDRIRGSCLFAAQLTSPLFLRAACRQSLSVHERCAVRCTIASAKRRTIFGRSALQRPQYWGLMAATHIYGWSETSGKVVELIDINALPSGTPADGTVTNAKLADMVTARIKGRVTAGDGDPEDLTAAQVRTLLDVPVTADAYNRTNHTGTQAAATISDLTEVAQDLMATTLVAGTNITLIYNDPAGTITIDAAAGVPGADSVTNVILANMAESTIKGRAAGAGTGRFDSCAG